MLWSLRIFPLCRPSPVRLPAERGESAVGLAFVAIVLVSLFAAGSLGVLATRDSAPVPARPRTGGHRRRLRVGHPGRQGPIVNRFRELMLLREIALRERDPRLLESVYAAAPGLARDRAEIERLRDAGRRLDGLRLPVKVFDAYRSGNGTWVVTARLGRSPARPGHRLGPPGPGDPGHRRPLPLHPGPAQRQLAPAAVRPA